MPAFLLFLSTFSPQISACSLFALFERILLGLWLRILHLSGLNPKRKKSKPSYLFISITEKDVPIPASQVKSYKIKSALYFRRKREFMRSCNDSHSPSPVSLFVQQHTGWLEGDVPFITLIWPTELCFCLTLVSLSLRLICWTWTFVLGCMCVCVCVHVCKSRCVLKSKCSRESPVICFSHKDKSILMAQITSLSLYTCSLFSELKTLSVRLENTPSEMLWMCGSESSPYYFLLKQDRNVLIMLIAETLP